MQFLGEDRVIVSNVAGTTRDAVDTEYSYDDQNFVLIDTAGMRKKEKSMNPQKNILSYAWGKSNRTLKCCTRSHRC